MTYFLSSRATRKVSCCFQNLNQIRNNPPWYVLIDYGKLQADAEVDNEILEDVATGLLQKHRKAFEELAK